MMRCERAQELMNYSLDADLPPGEAAAFYHHVSICDRCADEYAELARLVMEAKKCPSPQAPPGFWDDVWRGIRTDVLRQRRSRTPWLIGRLKLATVAVAIAVMVVAAGIRFTGDNPPEEMHVAEASGRHGIVLLHHPYADRGLAMLALSESTVASYKSGNGNGKE